MGVAFQGQVSQLGRQCILSSRILKHRGRNKWPSFFRHYLRTHFLKVSLESFFILILKGEVSTATAVQMTIRPNKRDVVIWTNDCPIYNPYMRHSTLKIKRANDVFVSISTFLVVACKSLGCISKPRGHCPLMEIRRGSVGFCVHSPLNSTWIPDVVCNTIVAGALFKVNQFHSRWKATKVQTYNKSMMK